MNNMELDFNLFNYRGIDKNTFEIHFDSIVVDTHNDTMMKVVDSQTGLPKINIGKDTDFQIDIKKAKTGGLNVIYFAAFSDYEGSDDISVVKANSKVLSLINALYWTVENNSNVMTMATSVSKIKDAVFSGKIAAVPTIEGAYALAGRNAIELLDQYYDLGVRCIGYVWNSANALGAGIEGPTDMGLTELGYEITKEMNKLGIIIDVSHMNEKTFWDVIKVSEAPVIASHSCVFSLINHVRNLTDDQIIAIADTGGVVNLNYWWELLGDTQETTSIKNLVDHIDYIVNLVGIDYVGLGSDFDGATMPVDLQTCADLPNITVELIERGYSKSDIEKILGLNNLRVMEKVQEIAQQYSLDVDRQTIIIPSFDMGAIIQDEYPTFTAKIGMENDINMNQLNFRVIIDGIVYNHEYNRETNVLSAKMKKPLLKKNFHIVTFECKSDFDKVARETRIFYMK